MPIIAEAILGITAIMGNTLGAGGGNYFDTAVFNALVPKEGPKALALNAPFTSSNTSFLIDFTLTQTQSFISIIQGVYINNYLNDDVLTMTIQGTNQTLTFPANSMGYLPLLVSKPSQITVSSQGQVTVQLIFLNVPVPAIIWPESSGGGGGTTAPLQDGLFAATTTATGSWIAGAIFGVPEGSVGEAAALSMDSVGNLRVIASAYQPSTGNDVPIQVDEFGNLIITSYDTIYTQDASDGPVSPGTAASYSSLAGGVYNATAPTLTTGQQAALQLDAAGNLKTNIAADADNPIPTSDAADGPVSPGTAATKSMLGGGVYNSLAPTLTTGQQVSLQLDVNGNLKIAGGAALTSALGTPGPTTGSSGYVTGLRLTSALANTGVIKSSAGLLYLLCLINMTAAVAYLHIYNQATAPTLGTSTPLMTFPMAAGQAVYAPFTIPPRFSTGMAYALTTDNAAAPATGVTVGGIEGTIGYL